MAGIVDPEQREVEVLRSLVTFRDLDVLDIGCGEGRTARRIARTAASVLGVDPHEERIATACGATPEPGSCEARFLAEDVVTFERPPASFDVIIFSRSL